MEVSMRLLVVRHGKAKERDEFAASGEIDSKRPLTRKGRRRMTDAAIGLQRLLPEISLIATSPLVRAEESARLIAEIYPDAPVVTRNELAPAEGEEEVIHWLNQRGEEVIAIVGHEPDLSRLIGMLLKPNEDEVGDLEKGAMCLIAFPERCERAAGKLAWHKSAKQLGRDS
jgi:phosphohistidine phosphatase